MVADFLDWAGNIGFPIAVASYLLMRMEERLKRIEEALQKLCFEAFYKVGSKKPDKKSRAKSITAD